MRRKIRNIIQNLINRHQTFTASDINAKGSFCHRAILLTGYQLCKFRQKRNREIIHTKIACIFQHLQYRTFACP